MIGRVYSVVFENVAISAAQDLFEITPADDKPVRLLGLMLSNVGGVSDAGDAQEEDLRITVNRGNTTSGSGGSAPTPQPLNSRDAAAGFTAEVNNTTRATTGTKVVLHADGWNTRQGYQFFWTPETYIMASQADTLLTIALEAAPADSFQVSGTAYFEEI